jgi:hypothetical protein
MIGINHVFQTSTEEFFAFGSTVTNYTVSHAFSTGLRSGFLAGHYLHYDVGTSVIAPLRRLVCASLNKYCFGKFGREQKRRCKKKM